MTPLVHHFHVPRSFAVVSAIALLLTGCSASPKAAENTTPVSGGTLNYASGDAEPTCLDPHVGGNYPQALVGTQFLESLVSRDSAGTIIPWLASSWSQSADGLAWDFTLRGNVTFTDGTPFDAAAVQANIAHVQDPKTGSSTGYLAVRKVVSTSVVSPTVVRLTLNEPDSALLESLSQPWLAMESPKALARSQDENCAAPVGTGPFEVASWAKQDAITLVRNGAYTSPPADAAHTGPAYLDSIVWRFIPDSASRYAALQSGAVDVIDNAQPDTIMQAEKSSSIRHLDAPRPGASNRIELNSGRAPFNDPLVREAFVRASDVDSAVSSLFQGTATRSFSALSSIEPLGVSRPDLFGYDQAAAGTLLDSAGWTGRDADGYRTKDGVRLTVVFPVSTNQSIPAEQSLFEQLQATAKTAGFDVVLSPLDLSAWYTALGSNAYDAVSAPYTKVGPDVLRTLFDSAGIVPAPSGYFANHAQVNDATVDAWLTEASQTADAPKRAALYAQAQNRVLEGFYILPLYDQQNHYLLSSVVSGTRAMPTVSTPTFYDAWLNR
ncbi:MULTISPECIES: ABC transporter substrate-binding protein [unclassified Cryobacterium]|uniref:ABC transporter substrate-binding protein n=1 Tax=unclassified Cryobacterium TaxID=2649013 RepID=UPI002AB51390|nr:MULTISPECIES: ABC transporter substrate-binding protein [unclassified Cryobacterium]MDY7544146.1 ABC transporter substrate-binding protein [Cryobacterium sp. 5B3]MEB0000446.1 ABC transporter substrate-binding protein [Cryobacterium sp. RTS3]MEB0266936.1 ABC transporter substrate-binding protein [Cryobacterium sp. 10I5]MEB0276166.1 ABC transporter substrate-binding protein [Cryobacterium sp. 5B3]